MTCTAISCGDINRLASYRATLEAVVVSSSGMGNDIRRSMVVIGGVVVKWQCPCHGSKRKSGVEEVGKVHDCREEMSHR